MSTTSRTDTDGKEIAEHARHHPALAGVSRFGYVVLGLVYLLIGWLAIRIVIGAGQEEASNSGALSQVADAPGGRVLLWAGAVGLVALSVWRLLQIIVGPELKHRLKGLGTGVVYLALALTAARFAAGAGTSDGQTARDVTATVLAQPAGVVAVSAAGLVVLGVGGYLIYNGARRKFKDELTPRASSGTLGTGIMVLGMVGNIARGVAFAVLGGLIVWAAVSHDPEKARGLDAALRYIGQQPFGAVLLIIVGVGLMCFGIFCLARARYRDAVS